MTGVDTVMYKAVATDGLVQYVPSIAYLMEDAAICLFSPQTYFQSFGGSGTVLADVAILHAGPDQHGVRHDIVFPIDVNGSNVPMFHGVSCTTKERVTIGPHLQSCHARHLLNLNLKDSVISAWYPQFDDLADETGYAFQFTLDASSFGLSNLTAAKNANLTATQKELLLKS